MAAFQGHDTPVDEPFAPGDQVYAEDGDGWRLASRDGRSGACTHEEGVDVRSGAPAWAVPRCLQRCVMPAPALSA